MFKVWRPLQHWVWSHPVRRGQRLIRFSEVEADSGRDLARAAEVTRDSRLRRLYLRHAEDEKRHSEIFRRRGAELLNQSAGGRIDRWQPGWLAPGERGLDDLRPEPDSDGALLAFLHLSEGVGARRFLVYRDAVGGDSETREVFTRILKDEIFHMNYTRRELARVSPRRQNWLLWWARLERVWKLYLRFAVAVAGIIGAAMLTLQYFILLPGFAWAAKRAERLEPEGWTAPIPDRDLRKQF